VPPLNPSSSASSPTGPPLQSGEDATLARIGAAVAAAVRILV
jgi:hypothetical protein